ncbi:MAG: PaaX family transcriptional regulator [Pseudonocardiaceae bacterium]|nr:PaaX family transcriptional regulator [Pseudonocardiaceae bacterium]
MLSFLGIHVLGQHTAVFSGSVIDVFARVGVSEEAVRSTLARMVNRGLLVRHRRGRRMYFGLTERSAGVLRDGQHRVWHAGAVNSDWDGTWTLVGFSLPEDWRSLRHHLRSLLIWGGFGPLQNGLWIAPGEVDVPGLFAGLDLDIAKHLKVFTGYTAEPTEAREVIDTAFDVPAIAAGYADFVRHWDREHPGPDAPDDLARQLLLHTDWLELVRSDPRLPAAQLPPDWPAIRAEQVFRALARAYQPSATAIAAEVLDTIRVG